MADNSRAVPLPIASSPSRRSLPLRPTAMVRLGALAAFLGFWEGGVRAGFIDQFFFSSPILIWDVLARQFATGAIYKHLFATVEEALWGLALGLLAGALLGWLAAQKGILGELIEPVLMLLNSIPRIVLAPIFIMWLGIGVGSKIALAFFLVFVVIFFAVYSGIREVDRTLIERVLMLGGSQRDLMVHVYIPSVLAWVFSSLRITVGFAFTGAVVGEFIASSKGLGYLLNFAQNSFNSSLMMATVAVIMAIILAIFAAMERIESWAMGWKRAT